MIRLLPLLFLAACEPSVKGTYLPEDSICGGWREIPALVEGQRCFLVQTAQGSAGQSGVFCYPESAPFVPCAQKGAF